MRTTSQAYLHAVCMDILTLTAEAPLTDLWRRERNSARRILRQLRKPGYLGSEDCDWDYDWAHDTRADLHEMLRREALYAEAEEAGESPETVAGWRQSDYVAGGGAW